MHKLRPLLGLEFRAERITHAGEVGSLAFEGKWGERPGESGACACGCWWLLCDWKHGGG